MNQLELNERPLCISRRCHVCRSFLVKSIYLEEELYLNCDQCQKYIKWNDGTKLHKSKLHYTQLEKLILLYLQNITIKDAHEMLSPALLDDSLNINTIKKYFTLFSQIVLKYYQEEMNCMLLENEVEIDETHLFREKKSSAPHRGYKMSSIWLFGMKERKTSKFVIIPIKTEN